eukprot:7814042-Pyramimonas_sp.AAC.1
MSPWRLLCPLVMIMAKPAMGDCALALPPGWRGAGGCCTGLRSGREQRGRSATGSRQRKATFANAGQ